MGCRDDRKMANGVGKHKLLVIGPTEPWSVREKLCLATSVMRSGDQNWVSVSRAIKPFAESGRPPDWFSQKHCASKYSELLETTQSPKRKRGEKGEVVETIQDMIVRRLTADRIDELKKLIKETQEKHRKLKREAELIQAGHLDSKLQELWEDIVQKKKLEVEEAEVKRKNSLSTDQARQVTKNTPKRISGNTIYSPSNCSPSHEFSTCDPLECVALDQASTKSPSGSVRLRTISESPVPIDSVSDGSFQDDNVQKNFLVQKATPSPLLSELLKKGNILATKSRLIGEGDMSTAIVTGAHDLQLAIPGQPLSQAAGSPMLSRLLEPGPTPFSPSLDFMVLAESATNAPLSATTAVSVDSSASASSVMQADESAEDKVLYLSEEDVSVSYMGDELDLKTMGDIIAIIEDKADETAEALDAAAVEAALSLCEENGHAFSSAWGSGLFQPHESHPSVPKGVSQSLQPSSLHSNLEGKTKVLEHRGGTSASLSSLCSSQDNCLAAFSMGLGGIPPTSSSSFGSKSMEHIHTGETLLPEETKLEAGKIVHQTNVTIKYERRKWAQQRPDTMHRDSVLEDSPLKERHPKDSKVLNGIIVGRAQNTSGTQVHIEVNGPEVCGEEEGEDAEGYLSEPDGEDGYSPQTASSSLQLHPTTDSIPSSPASSQFSVCSEDREALQAHKIWKKAIMLVWRAAANHRYANVFLQPVTDDIAPGYHSIVHRPMDLASIKKNIETGLIRTTAEFQRDIMLMFQNAVMYNSLDHDVYHMGVEMQRDVLEQIQQFLATQLIMETSESGIGAKSLRGRENTQKQDSSDKDAVSMSSPAFLLSLFDGGTRGRRCAIEADLRMKK